MEMESKLIMEWRLIYDDSISPGTAVVSDDAAEVRVHPDADVLLLMPSINLQIERISCGMPPR